MLKIPANAEVIVLDDASDDETFTTLSSALKDSAVQCLQNETNQGRSSVRNKLASLVKKSESIDEHWLLYVDGDCSFDSNFMTTWCDHLQNEKSNACVIGRVRYKATELSSFSRYLDRSSGPWAKDIVGELPHKYFATGHVAISKKSFDLALYNISFWFVSI